MVQFNFGKIQLVAFGSVLFKGLCIHSLHTYLAAGRSGDLICWTSGTSNLVLTRFLRAGIWMMNFAGSTTSSGCTSMEIGGISFIDLNQEKAR